MLEPKAITINGKEFVLHPLRGFTVLTLDKKVTTLLIPVIAGIKSLDTDIDMSTITEGLTAGLDKLTETEYEQFICKLLSTVQYTPLGATPVEITKDTIDNEFRGDTLTIYQLMFKVMEYNNFTPFALVSKLGKGTLSTLFSQALTGQTETL